MTHFINAATAIRLLSGILFITLFSACDTTRTVDVIGSFSMNVSGDGINERFNGNVFLGEERDDQDRLVAGIVFTDYEKDRLKDASLGDGNLGTFARAGALEDIGRRTYSIDDIATFAGISENFLFVFATDQQKEYYAARGGTVNITRASGGVIEGSFTMTGVQIEVATEIVRDVTINGTFVSGDRIVIEEPLFWGPAPVFFTIPLF